MRLFLLPISTRRTLIYCQRINEQLTGEQTYIDKVTTKASTTWVKWEKYEKGWQKKITEYGNKLFQRLPYEEWGLKSIPPLSARQRAQALQGKEKVDVEFPLSNIQQGAVLDVLRKLGTERQALHKKWMWGSIIGMPFTAPFALLPVAPNIPFFYLVFRAWSHWRALSGSQHITFLLDNHLIHASPSSILDTLYAISRVDTSIQNLEAELARLKSPPNSTEAPTVNTPPASTNEEEMLLSRKNSKLIAAALDVPELEAEIERAVQQVEKSLAAAQELQEEKQELDSVAAKASSGSRQ